MFLRDFCKLNKTPSDGTCLGEPPRGFCDVGCCCCFTSQEVFLSLLLSNVIPHSFMSYPWVFTLILYFQSSSSQSDLRLFHLTFLGFPVTVLPRVLRFWAAVFYQSGIFYLYSFPTFSHVLWLRCGQEHPIVPALKMLFLPADAWSWTTHILHTRPLVYQLRRWATKY